MHAYHIYSINDKHAQIQYLVQVQCRDMMIMNEINLFGLNESKTVRHKNDLLSL